MPRYEYAQPFDGTERSVTRPDGTVLRTLSTESGGRAVVLAHGYGGSADHWSLLAPMLVQKGLRVIAFDQRGHDRSTIGSDGIGTDQMAGDYEAVLDAHDVSNGVLVGHSMGGFLALAFLLDNPSATGGRIGSLMLMATFAGDVNRKNAQNRLQIPLIQSGILTRLLRSGPVAQAFTKSLIGDDYEAEMADAFIPKFLASDHSKLIPILKALVNESRYDRLGELNLPCTVVVGTKDKTTPPFHTDELHAGIADSKLVRIAGKGHGLNWEAPDVLAAEIGSLAAV